MRLGQLATLNFVFLGLTSCGGTGDSQPPAPTPVVAALTIDASQTNGMLRPLWRDHYDLSFEQFQYSSEPGFSLVLADLEPRFWRCSIGRWEIGFPPPAGGDSTNPGVLGQIEREFYRGPNTLQGADDEANYHFAYLDALLAGLVAEGVSPYLCFDYMPFVLAAEQDPFNPHNANLSAPGSPYSTYSFSNGIRTAPPSDPLVYARVVRNVLRHALGLFAGSVDYGVRWFEIGNEPDLVDLQGNPLTFFWTGSEVDFYDMYAAIAAEVDADPDLSGVVQLGAGSFAFLPTQPGVAFLQSFLSDVALNTPRLDFLSFHSYGDLPQDHLAKFLLVQTLTNAAGVQVPWVNAEWGRDLGDTEPLYDQIGHGLLRAKVLALMQVFPFVIGHEALLRDPGTSGGELGLIRTNPIAHKPASRVLQALNHLNGALEALEVTNNPSGLYVLPGKDSAGTRVVVAIVVDPPQVGTLASIELEVQGLPWGASNSTATLYRVTQASSDANLGPEVFRTESVSGAATTLTWDVAAGAEGLYLVEWVH